MLKYIQSFKMKLEGAKFHCSVCNRRVKAFNPLPSFYSENMKKHGFPYERELETCNFTAYSCPFCAASDRDRLSALYIRKCLATDIKDKLINVLDIAPSPPLSRFLKDMKQPGRELTYRTADLYEKGVDDKVDISDMKIYRDGQFNFLLCSHVLEHVPDDRKALSELYRVLKPGGRAILMVPIVLGIKDTDEDPSVVTESDRWKRFGQFNHLRLYSKSGFVDRIEDAGFSLRQYGNEFFGEDTFIQNGLTPQSILYVARK